MTASAQAEQTITLSQFLFDEEGRIWQATGELTRLINSIQIATKQISALLRRVGIANFYNLSNKNEAKKLQTTANDIFINMMSSSHSAGVIVTQELAKPVEVEKSKKGKYMIAVDPLDGMSNIDCSITVGSIFLIMVKQDDDQPTAKDILFEGNKIVAAGYVMYGSATVFVLTTGDGVHSFVLDTEIGEFILMERNLKIPKKGSIYSINEGWATLWDDVVKEYVMEKKFPSSGKPYSSRYIGTMVADVHRTIKHGGIFMYPKTKEYPNGKLKLLYECKPMAFLVVQAGGGASNGTMNILDIKVTDIHQKTPIFLGSKKDVEEFVELNSKGRK